MQMEHYDINSSMGKISDHSDSTLVMTEAMLNVSSTHLCPFLNKTIAS